uniref:Uncharacterized protein n=1 Tax=Globisporangium ultimum (strain ATCC 200006 / CBS 805.95 / DAOM BR144) TaxID=431595 RepID=K3WE41_GLOUD
MTASTSSEQSGSSSSASGAKKTRNFMRAVGGVFHRRSRDSDLRESMLEASITSSAVSSSGRQAPAAPAASSSSSSSSALRAGSADDAQVRSSRYRKVSSVSASSKYSVDTAPSDDDDDEHRYHYQFLFYPGSAEDNSFKPEKVTSSIVEIDYNAIRPSLTLQMPVFFSPPTEPSNFPRRSSILTDPREYELSKTVLSSNASESEDGNEDEDKRSEISDSEFSEGVMF